MVNHGIAFNFRLLFNSNGFKTHCYKGVENTQRL